MSLTLEDPTAGSPHSREPDRHLSMRPSTNAHHIQLITRYALKNSVRGGAGLVFLMLSLLFGLSVAYVILTPIEMAIGELRKSNVDLEEEEVLAELVNHARGPVTWALSPPESSDPTRQRRIKESAEAWADYLLHDRPAVLSAIFLVLLFGMPFVLPFGAFDQTAGDIGSRGLRYQLLRTRRRSIFLGRFLGSVIFSTIVSAVTLSTVSLYLAGKLRIYSDADLFLWTLLGFVALFFLSLPYIALGSWVSAANSSSWTSLVILNLIIGGIPLVAFLGQRAWEPIHYLKWLLPWGFQNELLAPTAGRVALATLLCSAYAAVYLVLGLRHFEKRDL